MEMSGTASVGSIMKLARVLSVLLMLIGSYFMMMRMESALGVLLTSLASLVLVGVMAIVMQLRWRTAEREEVVKYFRTALGCVVLLLMEYSTLMFFYITRP